MREFSLKRLGEWCVLLIKVGRLGIREGKWGFKKEENTF